MVITLRDVPLPDGRNADLTFDVDDDAATYERGHAYEPEGCVTVTRGDLRAMYRAHDLDSLFRRAVEEAGRVTGRRAA